VCNRGGCDRRARACGSPSRRRAPRTPGHRISRSAKHHVHEICRARDWLHASAPRGPFEHWRIVHAVATAYRSRTSVNERRGKPRPTYGDPQIPEIRNQVFFVSPLDTWLERERRESAITAISRPVM
jgi:hypothetical protein